jgi:hypothetical protein
MAAYHVTRSWDGGDLRSLARQIDDGEVDLDAALAAIAAKWCDGSLAKAEAYLDQEGHHVHLHGTLAEAIQYRDEWCEGGTVLEVALAGLEVEDGIEYLHPVVRDAVPADRVRVVHIT